MPEPIETIPELDPGVSDLLQAYQAETSRDPAQIEAALEQVNAKLAVTGSAGAAATVSTTAKVLLAGLVLSAGAWLWWNASPSQSAAPTSVVVRDIPSPAEVPIPPELPTDPELSALSELPTDPELPTPSELPTPPEPPPDPGAPTLDPPPSPDHPARPAAGSPRPADATEPTTPSIRPARRSPKPASESEAVDVDQPDSLAAELRLLQQARTALRAGRGTRALDHVREHRQLYPSSSFAEERDATEVMALCAVGRTAQAETKAADYRRRFAESGRDVLAACND